LPRGIAEPFKYARLVAATIGRGGCRRQTRLAVTLGRDSMMRTCGIPSQARGEGVQ